MYFPFETDLIVFSLERFSQSVIFNRFIIIIDYVSKEIINNLSSKAAPHRLSGEVVGNFVTYRESVTKRRCGPDNPPPPTLDTLSACGHVREHVRMVCGPLVTSQGERRKLSLNVRVVEKAFVFGRSRVKISSRKPVKCTALSSWFTSAPPFKYLNNTC